MQVQWQCTVSIQDNIHRTDFRKAEFNLQMQQNSD